MVREMYYTVPKLAERWDTSARSIWRMIAAGNLKTSRFGERMTRIAESEVLRVEAEAARSEAA